MDDKFDRSCSICKNRLIKINENLSKCPVCNSNFHFFIAESGFASFKQWWDHPKVEKSDE